MSVLFCCVTGRAAAFAEKATSCLLDRLKGVCGWYFDGIVIFNSDSVQKRLQPNVGAADEEPTKTRVAISNTRRSLY